MIAAPACDCHLTRRIFVGRAGSPLPGRKWIAASAAGTMAAF